jgi:hypothetical protein
MKFRDLLDLAMAKSQTPSLNKLSRKLGISCPSVSAWGKGTSLPTDNHLISIAKLAGMQPEIALLWGASWRTDGEARERYERMAREAETRFGFTLNGEIAA